MTISLKVQDRSGKVIIGPTTEWPMIFAIALLDWKIIDARNAKPHQALLIEFPVFIAVAAEPISAVVMTFIGKTYCDAVLAKVHTSLIRR
jgi:hypothetical protein